MPVAAFSGRRGWGYDGVSWYAPHEPYGAPDAMKRFVDAAHAHGIGVLLDVVYNHFGPEGNMTGAFGPYVHDAHMTPWGPAVNLDGPWAGTVRRFVIDSALHWLRDYHLDGLRLDAVHALVDDSAVHLLEELRSEVAALGTGIGRRLTLIAENDTNDPRLVSAPEAGGTGLDAVWADDLHHALHAVLTGERQGYYEPFGLPSHIAKAIDDVYVHDGTWLASEGRRRGRPVGTLDRHRFVVCGQNHDQVGNRARGDRLEHLAGPHAAMVAAAIVLLGPATPMLFMGEEWAASTPFLFFCETEDDELAAAIREGRRAEFAAFGWRPDDVADPNDPAAMAASVLRWDERSSRSHAAMLSWYSTLMHLRHAHPDLRDGRRCRTATIADDRAGWLVFDRGCVSVAVNLSGAEQLLPKSAGLAENRYGGAPVHRRTEVLASSAPSGTSLHDDTIRLAPMSVAVVGPVS